MEEIIETVRDSELWTWNIEYAIFVGVLTEFVELAGRGSTTSAWKKQVEGVFTREAWEQLKPLAQVTAILHVYRKQTNPDPSEQRSFVRNLPSRESPQADMVAEIRTHSPSSLNSMKQD